MYITNESGQYSKFVQRCGETLMFDGNLTNGLSHHLDFYTLRIALDGFKKTYYPHADGDQVTHISPKQRLYHSDQLATSFIDATPPHSSDLAFDAVVSHGCPIPMRTLNQGGPHGRFIDMYALGFRGLLMDTFPIFLPQHIDPVSASDSSDAPMNNSLPSAAKWPSDPDEPPTYQIVSRSSLCRYVDSFNLPNPEMLLVPVKLKATDPTFIGFIPALYLLAQFRQHYLEKFNAATKA